MRLNRRNVLFVLGTTILLGGMLIGSGAFSQVEASRDVTVNTAGDGSAALGLNVTGNHANVENTGSDTGAVKIRFSDLNDNATFRFDDVLTITNNGGRVVKVNISTSTANGVSFYNETRTNNSSELSLGTFSNTDTQSVGFVVDTNQVGSGATIEITVSAEDTNS